MVNRRRKSRPPSMLDIRFRLTRIVSRHDQLKIVFHQLKSQIKTGLLEAEDVFASLAIPLTRLVGLKTVEMAEEGRSSTIFMTADLHTHGLRKNEIRTETRASSTSFPERGFPNRKICKLEEDYTNKATMAGQELIQKQRQQLAQLVHLLRQIEGQVNSSQSNLSQTIADHQVSIHKFFQKAVTYVSDIHQSNQSNGTFIITLKLLKATYDHIRVVLGSVEDGVDDLMNELAERMCNPMVQYVKGLKAEMTTGSCPRLLAMVEEMGGVMKNGKMELEEARKKVRVEEERKIEALRKLKDAEENVRKMKEHLGFYLEAKKAPAAHSRHKLLGLEEDQLKDEKLLWELMTKKRKCQTPESPLGPKELLCIETSNIKRCKPTLPHSGGPIIKRTYSRRLSPKTPCFDSWLPLGSSPSATTQNVLSRKRITP